MHVGYVGLAGERGDRAQLATGAKAFFDGELRGMVSRLAEP